MKWQCPICLCKAYQREGGVKLPVDKYETKSIDEVPIGCNLIVKKRSTYTFNKHFRCRGCSVYFDNPKLFNLAHVQQLRSNHDD